MPKSHALALVPEPRLVRPGEGRFRLAGISQVRRTLDGFLSPEAYVLSVGDGGVVLRGGDDAGLFYGMQTLLQLLPSDRWAPTLEAVLERGPVELPHVHIEDAPAFRWRGLMLDVARHFQPVSFLYRVIDLLAALKLNVLHLHLTDDQGWRIPIPGYPRLTSVGATRSSTIVGYDDGRPEPSYDGVPHGGAYTRAELAAVVAYAAERHIEIVPEIDLPGHASAAIAAYPELGNGEPAEVWTRWGISRRILNLDDPTLEFVRAVFAEVADIFPGTFVHAGGDEVPKAEWEASPGAQIRIAELGLPDEERLQGWFTTETAGMLRELGRRMVGWDEVVDGGAPKDTVVMAWRSAAHGTAAVRAGYDVVMSPCEYVYLDHAQSLDTREPVTFPHSAVSLRRVFEFEPGAGAAAEPGHAGEDRHGTILGGQANLWTEYVPTAEHAEYMLFPRLHALAEAVWRQPLAPGGAPGDSRDYDDFLRRLRPQLARLSATGVAFRPLDGEPTTS
ncbi:beta-N-acetylhexosaminidase [Planctomonas psychrotolerans]|uniref:beta-N-acetylhexosaminidase n=1 Tax=Planctomonas psychrotolerans TaxID=2528712 RepID=UPI00123A2160|nr:beta-N-acetylhexosaminidase [Planctomonas psychrotolerans]